MPPGVFKQPGVGVPQIGLGGVAPIGPGQPLDRRDLAGAGDLRAVGGIGQALANSRATERARSNVFSVFSNFQRVPSHCSQVPHCAQ